jgi:uncharacterized protein (DUF433 family)
MSSLAQGFYTNKEAAQLIEIGNIRTINRWLDGSQQSKPLLKGDFHQARDTAQHELSFHDLMEVRFVEYFFQHGVKMRTLRMALESAREIFGTDKPFATNLIRFRTSVDKKAIYVEESATAIATKTEEPRLWNLLLRQQEIVTLTYDLIERAIEFDTNSHMAKRWHPRVADFPDIFIDPAVAYGKPVIAGKVPTHVIYEGWLAENKNVDAVRFWYDISFKDAQAAIDFERVLRGEVRSAAA